MLFFKAHLKLCLSFYIIVYVDLEIVHVKLEPGAKQGALVL